MGIIGKSAVVLPIIIWAMEIVLLVATAGGLVICAWLILHRRSMGVGMAAASGPELRRAQLERSAAQDESLRRAVRWTLSSAGGFAVLLVGQWAVAAAGGLG